jgi:hypothetical protein
MLACRSTHPGLAAKLFDAYERNDPAAVEV